MNNIIPFPYEGQSVRFNLDGWINATDIAKANGLRIDNWLRNEETASYVAALARRLNTSDPRDLIVTQRGRNGGTWLHPKLAVAFARWISADFAVWCDMRVDALLHGDLTLREQFDRACKALDSAKDLASLNGRELSMWRKRKPVLTRDVEHWRDQLQMSFCLESRA